RPFHCCRQHGAGRRRCFTRHAASVAIAATVAAIQAPEATLPLWEPGERPPFPPGEPTLDNMGNICGFRGLRLG
ncbi:ECM1 protein, partial [Brachypteracias leptosomus]|nr:ECM1 protein [Brachypteracias leptosomus]